MRIVFRRDDDEALVYVVREEVAGTIAVAAEDDAAGVEISAALERNATFVAGMDWHAAIESIDTSTTIDRSCFIGSSPG